MTILETRGREIGAYFTASELMKKHFPEPRWAVPGLIAEGLNLVVGAPKIGKSWLMLGIGVAVASGGVALGKVPVEPGDVLYAALEDTPRRLKGRLKMVLGNDEVPANLHITTTLPRGEQMADIVSEWLDAHPDARMVIIDVLRKVTPRSDGKNMYEADYDAMSTLKALADKHQVAVVAVHHTRKSTDEGDVFNEVSGSTGLTGAADATLIIKRPRNTAEAILHITGRDVTEHDYGLNWDAEACCWQMSDEPPALMTMQVTRRTILLHVTANAGDTPTQIAVATGIALATVKQTVRRMVDDLQLESDGSGHYFPSNSLSPMSPMSPDHGDGDSGDSGDTPTRVVNLFDGDHL